MLCAIIFGAAAERDTEGGKKAHRVPTRLLKNAAGIIVFTYSHVHDGRTIAALIVGQLRVLRDPEI